MVLNDYYFQATLWLRSLPCQRSQRPSLWIVPRARKTNSDNPLLPIGVELHFLQSNIGELLVLEEFFDVLNGNRNCSFDDHLNLPRLNRISNTRSSNK